MLTADRIAQLAALPKVRKIAVENFLSSMQPYGRMAADINLSSDARDYKWNAPTVAAIRRGIQECWR